MKSVHNLLIRTDLLLRVVWILAHFLGRGGGGKIIFFRFLVYPVLSYICNKHFMVGPNHLQSVNMEHTC